MRVRAKRKVQHDGGIYGPGQPDGEIINGLTSGQAHAIVGAGAAEWIPEHEAQSIPDGTDKEPDKEPDEVPEQPEDEPEDLEEAVKPYHKHFGRYDIPGYGMASSKDEAMRALRKVRSEQE